MSLDIVSGRRGLSARRAAKYIGVSVKTLNKWRKDGKVPRVPDPVEKDGVKLYDVLELDAFWDELKLRRGSPA